MSHRRRRPARRQGLRVAAVVFCLVLGAPAWPACKLQTMELPVNLVGQRAVATVGINGAQVPVMIDSGAFFSMLTEAAAKQLELPLTHSPFGLEVRGVTGRVDTQLTRVKRLELLKGNVPNVDFIVGGNEPGGGAMGLLGRNILNFADTEYDLAHGMIRFVVPDGDCDETNMAYWAGTTPVSEVDMLRDAGSRVPEMRAVAQVNGEKVRVLFDSGAPVSIVSLGTAKRVGMPAESMDPIGRIYGIGRGDTAAFTAAMAKFALGGESILNNRIDVADIELPSADMLLGIDFFLAHRIYFSKGQRRMYFTYNGGTVFGQSRAARTAAAASDAQMADESASTPPADADAYARRGAASAARGDLQQALADLDRACALAPETASHFSRRGRVHAALKQFPLALDDFETALRLDPGDADARMQRAWLRLDAGQRIGAIDDALTLDKQLAPQAHLRHDLAQLDDRLDMLDKAVAQWDLWIAAHRGDAGVDAAFNARCWARTRLGVDLDKALEDCDEAIDRQSKNPHFLDSRGWVHLRMGHLREALADYDRAQKNGPLGAWSLYGRGLARLHLGDAAQGEADIDAARKAWPAIDRAVERYGMDAGARR